MARVLIVTGLLFSLLTAQANAQETVAVLPAQATITQVPDLMNGHHEHQWVRLNSEGQVTGTVYVLNELGALEPRALAPVRISKHGKIVYETLCDEMGRFVIAGLGWGGYGLHVRGEATIADFALHILPQEAQHLPTDIDVYAVAIRASRYQELLRTNLTPRLEDSDEVYFREYSEDPLAAVRYTQNSQEIRLRDGNMLGRVSRPGVEFSEQDLSGSIAEIVRDQKVVARVKVSSDGYFRVKDLQPGPYALLVSGPDGIATVAFTVVWEEKVVQLGSAGKYVTTIPGMLAQEEPPADPEEDPDLGVELTQQPDGPVVDDLVQQPEILLPPIMGGGAYGGGGGGGGLGGGGLIGAAGLGIGIAALSDDDDGFNHNVASIIAP